MHCFKVQMSCLNLMHGTLIVNQGNNIQRVGFETTLNAFYFLTFPVH